MTSPVTLKSLEQIENAQFPKTYHVQCLKFAVESKMTELNSLFNQLEADYDTSRVTLKYLEQVENDKQQWHRSFAVFTQVIIF